MKFTIIEKHKSNHLSRRWLLTFLTIVTVIWTHFAFQNIAIAEELDSLNPPVHHKTVTTKYRTIDRIYKSMLGPDEYVNFSLTEDTKSELVWLIGARLKVIDGNEQHVSDEFICHTSLFSKETSPYKEKSRLSDSALPNNEAIQGKHGLVGFKFFDINQGATDLELPKGFGIPVVSNEPLVFNSMIMNHHPRSKSFQTPGGGRI